MLSKLVEAEQAAIGKGRSEALRSARDRFYKGDIARAMADFSEENGGLYRYEDFAAYTAQVETPVSTNYRGFEVYKNQSSTQGHRGAECRGRSPSGGVRLGEIGTSLGGSPAPVTSRAAASSSTETLARVAM